MGELLRKVKPQIWIPAAPGAALLVAALVWFLLSSPGREEESGGAVTTVSTLEKVIQVSELSTYTAVYNGIAEVREEEGGSVAYYVSYEARVYAGIDFKAAEITVDEEAGAVLIRLPDAAILDVSVDISSLDFMFYDEKANTSTVTQGAYRACEADALEESESQAAILELARQNAENVITALVRPLLEQWDRDYTLTVA